jgi:hypothetical protein
VNYKVFLFIFLFNSYASAESLLDAVIKNTDEQSLDGKIEQLELKLKNNSGASLDAVIERTQVTSELKFLNQVKARNILNKAIEETDVASMTREQLNGNSMRLQKSKMSSGSPMLDQVVEQTIKESNPAIMGQDLHKGRAFVLYRDVDPSDVYYALELGGSGDKKVLVYKKTDLRGRETFVTLDGKNSNVIVQGKFFTKEEVLIRDEAGNLVKAYPRAIYADGTLEVKDQYGITTRRAQGTYHLTDEVEKVSKGKIKTYSGNEVSVFGGDDSKLSAKEKKAIEALRKAFCNM